MHISVPYGEWGKARQDDVRALLVDVASHLTRPLRTEIECSVSVVVAPATDWTPKTRLRNSTKDPIVIQLTAQDTHWCQYAYQFSHEICHVLSNYERLDEENPNGWFHEAICELASVFTLRRMAERWPANPPYANWSSHAGALASYADDRLACEERQLPPGVALPEWLASHESKLRTDRYQRPENAKVAYALLPTFENAHEGWNAVRHLPNSTGLLGDYLRDWCAAVPSVDAPFVLRILEALVPDTTDRGELPTS